MKGLRSLRVRLTAVSAAVAALVLGAAIAVLLTRLHSGLVAAVDTAAVARAVDVSGLVRSGRLSAIGELPTHPDFVVQVISPGGAVVASSANAAGLHRLFTLAPRAGARTVRQVNLLHDTVDYRVAAVQAGDVIVYSGAPVDDVTDGVTVLATELAVGGPLLLGLLTVGAWLLVGRALQPVDQLRRQAQAITAADLDRRLAVPVTTELAALATTLNELLQRAHQAAEQQRRFIGDAAHELRNPVAGLLASLELHERIAADSDAHEMVQQAQRLSELVNDLLTLARLDDGAIGPHEPLDLARLLRAEVANRPGISLDVRPALVRADPDLLRRAIANLLDNAVRHARQSITVQAGTADGQVLLTISDDGPGVPPKERERIFERFTRLDDARTRDAGGVGLGLAIARQTITAAGGSIEVEDADPGARFVVRLPLPANSLASAQNGPDTAQPPRDAAPHWQSSDGEPYAGGSR